MRGTRRPGGTLRRSPPQRSAFQLGQPDSRRGGWIPSRGVALSAGTPNGNLGGLSGASRVGQAAGKAGRPGDIGEATDAARNSPAELAQARRTDGDGVLRIDVAHGPVLYAVRPSPQPSPRGSGSRHVRLPS